MHGYADQTAQCMETSKGPARALCLRPSRLALGPFPPPVSCCFNIQYLLFLRFFNQMCVYRYPKDTDKIMLAKQTGLTRSQVSNWFINARVRLWKPMVEEMYTEEVKPHQQQGSQHQNIAGKTKHVKPPKPKEAAETEIKNNTSSTAADIAMTMEGMEQFRPPYSGNGVSLTLGLQHCENLSNMSNQTMNLGPGRNHFAPPTSAHAHDSIRVYDSIDVQTSNKRFAAQFLPDFVT